MMSISFSFLCYISPLSLPFSLLRVGVALVILALCVCWSSAVLIGWFQQRCMCCLAKGTGRSGRGMEKVTGRTGMGRGMMKGCEKVVENNA